MRREKRARETLNSVHCAKIAPQPCSYDLGPDMVLNKWATGTSKKHRYGSCYVSSMFTATPLPHYMHNFIPVDIKNHWFVHLEVNFDFFLLPVVVYLFVFVSF